MICKDHIKLGIIFPNINPGGTERVLNLLTPMLHKRYDLKITDLHTPKMSTFKNNSGYNYSTLPFLNPVKMLGYILALIRLKKIFKDRNVVLAYGEVPILLASILKIFSFKNFKLIGCIRNYESSHFTSYFKKTLFSWCLNQCESITANSNLIKEDLIKSFKCNKPIYVIYNPIEVQSYNKNFSDSGPIKLINVGRLERQKGHLYFLEIIKRLNELNINVEAKIIGVGPEKYNLERFVKESQLTNVTLLPWQNNIVSMLLAADIYCSTSLWEGMPNVMLEALSVGLPVVSFDCPSGPSEIILSEDMGALIPLLDIEKFAAKIKELSLSSSNIKKMSKAGYNRSKDFNLPNVAKDWFRLIDL